MRRLILKRLAFGAVVLAAGCKKPVRVKADAPVEDEVGLKSVVAMADVAASLQLVRGFHALEDKSWRWTEGKFTATLRRPLDGDKKGASLFVKFTVPGPLLQRVPTFTLAANVNGTAIPGETYSKVGEYVYRQNVPAAALQKDAVTVEYAMDKFLAAGVVEGRELGLIVHALGLESM